MHNENISEPEMWSESALESGYELWISLWIIKNHYSEYIHGRSGISQIFLNYEHFAVIMPFRWHRINLWEFSGSERGYRIVRWIKRFYFFLYHLARVSFSRFSLFFQLFQIDPRVTASRHVFSVIDTIINLYQSTFRNDIATLNLHI